MDRKIKARYRQAGTRQDRFYETTFGIDRQKAEITLRTPLSELVPVATRDTLKKLRESAQKLNEKAKKGKKSLAQNWRPAATSREEYVANALDINYFRALAAPGPSGSNTNLFSFPNDGGLFNRGVCWWHSRFQRAALYLTVFLPDKPKPSEVTAKEIIGKLMTAECVVEIPGFKNFSEFSNAYQPQIQMLLENTQIAEGLFLFAWINGLVGKSRVKPKEMKKLLAAIYDEVQNNGIAYVKLQIPGLDAHAWLFTEMKKNSEGYICNVIDSDSPDFPWTVYLRNDSTHIDFFGGDYGVPYLQRAWELKAMKNAIKEYIKAHPNKKRRTARYARSKK